MRNVKKIDRDLKKCLVTPFLGNTALHLAVILGRKGESTQQYAGTRLIRAKTEFLLQR
jgi:hypothetical protein